MSTSDDDGRPLVDGRFRLVSRLGSGGMGTVWRARDIALDRDVALKEVRPPDPAAEAASPGLTAQIRTRAVREARALARLSHPHVVTVHHIVEPADGSAPWIVMELVEGNSVADRLAAGPLSVPEAITLGRQVLGALRAAHAAGIQHRDVKPANVLLRAGGGAVLTDFGIAVLDESTSRLTASGDLIGSAEFIAPERVRGEEGNPASDLWSLGMLLYVATEGHHPLRRATSLATVVAVLDDPIPPPVRSGALGPVLTRLLVRDPALRPDAALLDRLLAEAAAEAGATAEAGAGAVAEAGAGAVAEAGAGAAAGVAGGGVVVAGAVTPADAVPTGFGPATPAVHPSPPPPPYAHPAYGQPVPPLAGPGPAPRTAPTRRKRLATVAGALLLSAALLALGIDRFLPGGKDGGGTGGLGLGTGTGTGDGKRTGAADRTPAPGGTTGAAPATTPPATAATAAPASLLTPDGMRTVVAAFREATGITTVKQMFVYEQYAIAEIPTKPGAKTYDRYQYRDGKVSRQGVGGTTSASRPDDQPFDATRMPWDDLPALMKRADRELKVEQPFTKYLIVQRWTFNESRPTLLVYRTNDYSAVGYLAVDADGEVVHKLTAD